MQKVVNHLDKPINQSNRIAAHKFFLVDILVHHLLERLEDALISKPRHNFS